MIKLNRLIIFPRWLHAATHARCGASDCGQRSEAAGAIEKAPNCGEAPLLMLRDDDLSGGGN
jgi:hypothetical protein